MHQLYYDEYDEIQEIDIEDVDQRKDTEDEEALESEAWDSRTDTIPVETIEDIMTDIVNSMDKLEPKLHGVEFRNEYAQYLKVSDEINTLMELLGLECEENQIKDDLRLKKSYMAFYSFYPLSYL